MIFDQHYNIHNNSHSYHHDNRSLYSTGSRSPGSVSRSHHDSRSLYSGSSGSFDKENDGAQSRALRLMENVVVGTNNGMDVQDKTTIPKLSTFASTQVTTKTNHAIPLTSCSPFSKRTSVTNNNTYTTRVSKHDQEYITMYIPTNYNLKSKNYRKLEQMAQSTRQSKKARRTFKEAAASPNRHDSVEGSVEGEKCEIDLERERSAENRALRALLCMPTITSVALV
mmetsp:Transcript_23974/g.37035  ORF Transcript_23974/g.37035 Transcript_23974/m.37035 type:complete len:225 (+) Transcript_23974:148-822(+)